MSNVDGVKILKTGSDFNVSSDADKISGLIALVDTAPNSLAFKTSKKLESVLDAEAVGIDSDYDSDNSEILYENIVRFFNSSPNGVLWIMCVDNASSTPQNVLDDTDVEFARKLLKDANGKIRRLGVQVNPAALDGTYTDLIPDEIEASIAKAQTFSEWSYSQHFPCHVLLEGCDWQVEVSTASSASDLRALTGVVAPKVSLFWANDKAVADRGAAEAKRALIGTPLGIKSNGAVNENIAWVGKNNLTNVSKGYWEKAVLSNNESVIDYQAQWQGLDDKGYIFVKPYFSENSVDGLYINDDHVCAPLSNQEYKWSLGEVKDKAARWLRNDLLPFVKSPQPVDPDTGQLPDVVVENFNAIGEKALDRELTNNSEISGRRVQTDKTSDLITAPRTLKIKFAVVPFGEVGEIEGQLEFVTSLNG